MRRRVAQILWWVGFTGILVGALTPIWGIRPLSAGLWLGGGLVALGLNVLLNGEVAIGPEPRPFTARGAVVRGHLEARIGLSDLSIGVCGKDRIATVLYGPLGNPDFEVLEGVARLRLASSLLNPSVSCWRTDLADNVLWDIEARSLLGDLSLDLENLRLEQVVVRSALGHIHVTCPTRGYTQVHLRVGVGEVELSIPPQTGAKLHIKRGRLATLTIKNERLLATSPHHFATADFETAPAQVEIVIETSAGDIILS